MRSHPIGPEPRPACSEPDPGSGPLLGGLSAQIAAALNLDGAQLQICSLREHPFSRVVVCRASAENRTHSVVVKIFRETSGRLVEKGARECARDCFDKLRWLHSSRGCAVPRPLAILGPAVAMEMAPGRRFDVVFADGSRSERLAAFHAAGTWLAALARLPLGSVSAEDIFENEAQHVLRLLDALSGLGGVSAARISRWRAFFAGLAARAQPKFSVASPLWCHGDFICSNAFFLSPGLATVIDVDGMRPGFWPRDLVSILYDLRKRRFTSVAGARYAGACIQELLAARGYSWSDTQSDEFRFYWFRELLGRLHNLLKYSTGHGLGRLKTRFLVKVTVRMLNDCARGNTPKPRTHAHAST